jgi:hypothetical protein
MFGMLKKKEKREINYFVHGQTRPRPRAVTLATSCNTHQEKTREIAKLGTNKGIYSSFLVSFSSFYAHYPFTMFGLPIAGNSGKRCICQPEYSVFVQPY